MSIPRFHDVAVVGAGTMGAGIAQACAQSGHPTTMVDVDEAILEDAIERLRGPLEDLVEAGRKTEAEVEAIFERLDTSTDLADAVAGADLVIEAVPEKPKVKEDVFAQVADAADEETVVATNTSSLSVTDLADATGAPERFAGLHFFFPAMINRLVEVVPGDDTDPEVVRGLVDLAHGLGKVPIETADSAGFAVNRFFVPFLNEACRIHDEGVSIPTIEAAGKEALGIGMGPFELMNETGIEIAYHSQQSLHDAFGAFYEPSAILEERAQRGETWDLEEGGIDEDAVDEVADRIRGVVFGVAAQLVEEGVATPEATDVGAAVGLRWKQGPFALMNEVGTAEALERVEEVADRHDSFAVPAGLVELGEADEPWPLEAATLEKDGEIGWVRVQRPSQLNALNSRVLEDLDDAFRRAGEDEEIRVVVFTGAGKAFIAGADIRQMQRMAPIDNRKYTDLGQQVTRRIETLDEPVICAVNGFALGGGLEMALACDLLVFSEKATVGLPEVGLGIVPGFGGTQRLTRLIGRHKAKEVIFTGDHLDADRADELGIPNRVVDHRELRPTVRDLAQTIAANAPHAVALAKDLVNKGTEGPLETGLELEKEAISLLFSTEDKAEGMAAFLERRDPEFEGR